MITKPVYEIDWIDIKEKTPNYFIKFTYKWECYCREGRLDNQGESIVFCKDELTFLRLLNFWNNPDNERFIWKYWSE